MFFFLVSKLQGSVCVKTSRSFGLEIENDEETVVHKDNAQTKTHMLIRRAHFGSTMQCGVLSISSIDPSTRTHRDVPVIGYNRELRSTTVRSKRLSLSKLFYNLYESYRASLREVCSAKSSL